MSRLSSLVRAAAAAAIALSVALPAAGAQRHPPRYGVGVEPVPPAPVRPHPGWRRDDRVPPRRTLREPAEPRVIYVLPYGGYAQPAVAGGVTDVNGRPLSVGTQPEPGLDAIPSFTPDLSGVPFVGIEGGRMLVDFPNGERRTFASCVAEDPDGRPRTVFFDGGASSGGLVLRVGQRGVVRGQPPAGATACYGYDRYGRITLEY